MSDQARRVRSLFAAIAHRYDLANHLLSGGLDFQWRRQAARLVADWKPRAVLDVATGSGDLLHAIHQSCPGATVVGVDFCATMLRVAQRKGMTNLVAADALALPFADGNFDVAAVAFGLRNMASWCGALVEMRRVLRPEGHLLVLDFSMPGTPLRWFYRPYLLHVLPHIAVAITSEKSAYQYLGQSIESFPQGAAFCALLAESGFKAPCAKPLSGGIVSLYTAMA
jgi:demethylmenaquinone methyltransferase / 2-methoxy-6-polyprenyl-1,4-benzoquinol methylase